MVLFLLHSSVLKNSHFTCITLLLQNRSDDGENNEQDYDCGAGGDG